MAGLIVQTVAMTQQQYPGQFSQSARSEGGGSASGRTGEFFRFRDSLPRRSRPMFLVYVAAWCLMLDEPAPAQY